MANWPRFSWAPKSVFRLPPPKKKKTHNATDGVLHVETLGPGQFSAIQLQPPGFTRTHFIQSVLQHWRKHVSLNKVISSSQNQDPSVATGTD